VYHEAALASVPRSVAKPRDTHDHCTTGTFNVLEAARLAGVRRVVFAASSAAYGDVPTEVKRETDPPAPLSPYAASKIAGEMYCRAYSESMGLETVALRYFNVFGPRQDPEGEYSAVIPKFVTRMLRGVQPVVFGDGRQSRDFVYIDDVAAANVLAGFADAQRVSGKCFNVACGRQTNLLELIAALNGALGTQIEPDFQPPRAGDVRESLADISQAREFLGYDPKVGFAEGLKRSIDYYRSVAG
jgi:UDP-glucose 4-epimerase